MGVTAIVAASPRGLRVGSETVATPAVRSTAAASRSSVGWESPPAGTDAASCRVPLKPGPNPSESLSYATRSVVSRASVSVVGLAEAQIAERGGEREQHRDAGDQGQPRATR